MYNPLDVLPYHDLTENEFQDEINQNMYVWQNRLFNEDLTNFINKNCKMNTFKYYTEHQFNSNLGKRGKSLALSVFHINIRSLNKNQRGLLILLESLKLTFDVIVLSELWSYNVDFFHNLIKGYRFIYDLPRLSKRGGIGMFVNMKINCTIRENLKLQFSMNDHSDVCENLWVELNVSTDKYIIAGIYRHPRTNQDIFTSELEERISVIACGR